MRGLALISGLSIAAIAFAQPLPIPQLEPEPEPVEEIPAAPLTDIALAYTPDEGATALTVEAWDAGGATLGDTLGARVDYFLVEPASIRLTVGGRFDLATLDIVVHGLNGNDVPRAPLKLSLEAFDGLVDLELARNEQILLAAAPGIGRLWIESLLPRGTGTGERYRLPVVIVVR